MAKFFEIGQMAQSGDLEADHVIPLQLRDSSHCLLRNSKEPHFLLFYQWESGLLVRSHGTAHASGRRYQKNLTLLFTPHKTTWLTAVSSHCLAALAAINVCIQHPHATNPLTAVTRSEPLLPWYRCAIKTDFRTIRSKFHNLPLQKV